MLPLRRIVLRHPHIAAFSHPFNQVLVLKSSFALALAACYRVFDKLKRVGNLSGQPLVD
jgi:hypothetical protein